MAAATERPARKRTAKKAVAPARERATAKRAAATAHDRLLRTQPWRAETFANQAEVEAALSALKTAVVAKTRRLTRTHGWCDQANRALTELGLVTPPPPITVTYTVEVTADGRRALGLTESTEAQVRDYIRQTPREVVQYGGGTVATAFPDDPGPAA